MSFRPAISGCSLHGVVFTMWLGAGIGQAADLSAPPGQAIEFSEPRHDMSVTNVNQLSAEADSMQRLEGTAPNAESLRPSLASPYGLLPPPSGVSGVIINKRGKQRPPDAFSATELSTPEDAVRELFMNQLLKSSGLDRTAQATDRRRQPTPGMETPSVESLYERMLGGSPEASGARDSGWLNSSKTAEGQSGYTAIEQSRSSWTEDTLSSQGYLDQSPNWRGSVPGAGPDDLSGMFRGPAGGRASEMDLGSFQANQAALHDRLKRFQDILDGIYEPRPAATPQNAGTAANPWMGGTEPLPLAPAPEQANPLAKPPGTANPYPYLSPPSAPVAPVAPSAVPDPATPPPGRTPPPKPIFSIEKRVF